MPVETYEVTETTCDGAEVESEAVALIEKMGLDGQRKILARNESGLTRNPYRVATAEERFVYELLLTEHQALTKYDEGPIPLRVLQVAAHADGLFKATEVWSAAPGLALPDPLLVGFNRESSWETPKVIYLLARWGDVLLPFAELAKKACKIHRAAVMDKCREIIQSATGRLSIAEKMADETILGGRLREPTYSE